MLVMHVRLEHNQCFPTVKRTRDSVKYCSDENLFHLTFKCTFHVHLFQCGSESSIMKRSAETNVQIKDYSLFF